MATEATLGYFFLDNVGKNYVYRGRVRRQKKVNHVRDKLTKEDKQNMKYSDFEPVYKMWCEYYSDLAGPSTKEGDDRLLKADYHGALFYIADADNNTMHGIVCLETRYTFQIITEENKYLVIPKQGSTFQFILKNRVFTIFGDALKYRPSLRGKRQRLRSALPFLLR
ncbi:unnamed protein product [Auanema sp. JU1783]|nr:unnamed protein product [Auanema sp. JU1783]